MAAPDFSGLITSTSLRSATSARQARGLLPVPGREVDVQTRHIYDWERDPDGVWEESNYVGLEGRTRLTDFRWSCTSTSQRSNQNGPEKAGAAAIIAAGADGVR